ncbi:unnamed protein product [Sphagnum jensenii]|uniref:Uncharacterized protein n=1 Tax=Sphagnum jensenii TaxID=128206 RepID=A0ABP1C2R7_9BRYO
MPHHKAICSTDQCSLCNNEHRSSVTQRKRCRGQSCGEEERPVCLIAVAGGRQEATGVNLERPMAGSTVEIRLERSPP